MKIESSFLRRTGQEVAADEQPLLLPPTNGMSYFGVEAEALTVLPADTVVVPAPKKGNMMSMAF